MHENHAQPDNLSDLESRLAAWQPTSRGLDADRLIYAAGQASVKGAKARYLWPTISTALAALAVVLGLQLSAEHSARVELLAQSSKPAAGPSQAVAEDHNQVVMAERLPSDSLYAARRAVEHGLDNWTTSAPATSQAESAGSPIWHAWQSDRVLEP